MKQHKYMITVRIETKVIDGELDVDAVVAQTKKALLARGDINRVACVSVHKNEICDNAPFEYKGIRLQLIKRQDYAYHNAKRFTINGTNQNIWIPNRHLDDQGRLKNGENIDYVLRKHRRQCEIAGVDINTVLSK